MDTIVTPVTVITLDSTRITHNIKADLVARYFPPVVRLVQYDQSLPVIAVSLMQNGQAYTLPSGAAANIRVHKPDATYVYNPALGCDSTRKIVYFEVTQAMAAASGDGLAIVEIVVDGDIAGTSLITLHFEENPVPEEAIESSDEWETIYELGERIIASTVTPVSTAAGMTDHNVVYLYTGTESGWNQGHMYYYNGTTWVDAGIAVTDTTLSVAGLAADAKKTGDEIADLKDGLTNGGILETDSYEELTGVITTDGRVIGDLPNAHTSDIWLNKGDAIISYAYNYTGFSIVAEHSAGSYVSLVNAVSNAQLRTVYVAPRNMYVACSFQQTKPYSFEVVRNMMERTNNLSDELKQGLNNEVDMSSSGWELGSFDNSGYEYSANNRIRSDFLEVTTGTLITVTGKPSCLLVLGIDEAGTVLDYSGWITSNSYTVADGIKYVKLLLRVSTANETISESDIVTQYERCTISLKLPQSAYFDVSDEIPEYYESMMETKTETIKANMASIGMSGDSFVFITDYHIDTNTQHSPSLIKYIMKKCGINNIVFGGDALNSETTKAAAYTKIELFMEMFRRLGIDLRCIVGNHEFNNPSGSSEYASIQLSDGEVYPFMVKKEETNSFAKLGTTLAYYIDNPTQKIRYIYIPCTYTSDISSEVSTWVINAMNSAEDGYNIILIAHNALESDGSMVASFGSIATAFDALIGTTKKPVCIICGHQHRDRVTSTSGGIPIIATTCDSNIQEQGGLDRTAGTTGEQAFDVFQVNTNARTIKIVRIGAGSDRVVTY